MRRIIRALGTFFLIVLGSAYLISHWYEDIFLKVQIVRDRSILARELGKDKALRVVPAIEQNFKELEEHWPRVEKGGMRFQRVFAIHGVALYRALREELGEQEALVDLSERLMWLTGPLFVHKLVAFFLHRSKDPFKLVERGAQMFARLLFPRPPYERTDVFEVSGGLGCDFTKCPYPEFCDEEGVPELAITFCNQDWHMMKLFPPQIKMEREACMGKGDDRCEFRFYKR